MRNQNEREGKMMNRRQFLATSAAAIVIPAIARSHTFDTEAIWVDGINGAQDQPHFARLKSNLTAMRLDPELHWFMRTGSTAEECALARWRSYDNDEPVEVWGEKWSTGTTRKIWAEFTSDWPLVEAFDDWEDGLSGFPDAEWISEAVHLYVVDVPPMSPAIPPDYPNAPLLSFNTQFADRWSEKWVAYDEPDRRGNVFWPVSTRPGEGGYGWVDDSRFKIDRPDSNSVLFCMTAIPWHGYDSIDLSDARLTVRLRGRDLDLKGARIFFHVVTDAGRFHYNIVPMWPWPSRSWETWTFAIAGNPAYWFKSWSRDGNPAGLDRTRVTWIGLGFLGHSPDAPPTGIIEIGEIRVDGWR